MENFLNYKESNQLKVKTLENFIGLFDLVHISCIFPLQTDQSCPVMNKLISLKMVGNPANAVQTTSH